MPLSTTTALATLLFARNTASLPSSAFTSTTNATSSDGNNNNITVDDGHIKKNTAIGIGVGLFLFLSLLLSFWLVSRYKAPPRKETYAESKSKHTYNWWANRVTGGRRPTTETLSSPTSPSHPPNPHSHLPQLLAHAPSHTRNESWRSTTTAATTDGAYDFKRAESPTHMHTGMEMHDIPPAYSSPVTSGGVERGRSLLR